MLVLTLVMMALLATCSDGGAVALSSSWGLGHTRGVPSWQRVRGGERPDSSAFEQRNGTSADTDDVNGVRNATTRSEGLENVVLDSIIEDSGGSGMLRPVDPMMIDDDIFADNGLVAVGAKYRQRQQSVLGDPPEPPPPPSSAPERAGGGGAYVPNVMEDEDDDDQDEKSSLLVAPSASSSLATATTQGTPPRAEDIVRGFEERPTEEEEEEVLLTMEEREQTDFLREALQGAIKQQLQSPPFVPSISQALRSRLGPFRFKGFGSSCVKPLNKLHTVGMGLRIPVSANFPQYDANVGLPRLSSMLSVFSTYEESYLRWSVSTSLPTRVAAYYLAFLGFKAKLMPLSVSESIRLRRATDSVKRVGCTFSIRYGTVHGFKWTVGPWVYYLPGKKVMTRILPVIFASPALFIAVMNMFVDMQEVLGAFLGLESGSFRGDDPGAGGAQPSTQPYINIDDDLVGQEDGEEGRPAPRTRQAKAQVSPRAIQVSEVAQWHRRLLKWAATKTTGLGFNAGYGKTQGDVPGFRASMAFDIQPFFPSADSLSITAYRLLRVSKELWRGAGAGAERGGSDTGTGAAPERGGRGGDGAGPVVAVDRLYANKANKKRKGGGSSQAQREAEAEAEAEGARVRQIKRPGRQSRPLKAKGKDKRAGVGTEA